MIKSRSGLYNYDESSDAIFNEFEWKEKEKHTALLLLADDFSSYNLVVIINFVYNYRSAKW